jgi:hypothetical protein
VARPASEGCPDRYRREIAALRRLESAIEIDPNLSLARSKVSKAKLRSMIDDLAELITISENPPASKMPKVSPAIRLQIGGAAK